VREMLKKLHLFIKGKSRTKNTARRRKSTGQSLVEIAIAFPFIIILLSGVVEFGFVINYYLSLLDATREAARFWSNGNPFLSDEVTDNDAFYDGTIQMVVTNLLGSDPANPLIELDPAVDDIIVTVYSVYVPVSGTPTVTQHPNDGPRSKNHTQQSAFRDTGSQTGNQKIVDLLTGPGDPLVCTGILVVEVYWSYDAVLNLPWLDPLFPALLHTYSMMPLVAAEPLC